ncbi:MAG: Chaperone for flagella basal body P-ring formation [Actinomycetota bacterium]
MKFKTKPRALLPDRRKLMATFGILLILISFTIMYRSLQGAEQRNGAIVAVRDLPFGQVISNEDVKTILVDLSQAQGSYPVAEEVVIGKTVARNIYANELISNSMLGSDKNLRTVAMQLPLGSVPPNLQINDTIDLWWVNPETLQAENLMSSINTSEVIKDGSGYASTITVVVAVAPNQVGNLIAAMKTETIEVVKHES